VTSSTLSSSSYSPFLPALFVASREHDYGSRVALPAHTPEVVARRVQWSLSDDKLARRIVARHVVCVDVIAALIVINRLQLVARVVVWQDVGETVLRSIARQVGERARLVPSYMLQLLELLAESVRREDGAENCFNYANLIKKGSFKAHLKSESADMMR
jgi:hypothetical protein